VSADATPALTFQGTAEELKALVQQLGIPTHWEHKGAFELCVFDDGISNLKLNWWPETGELRLVGDPEVRVDVEQRLNALLTS
jgi:hypothetical protein